MSNLLPDGDLERGQVTLTGLAERTTATVYSGLYALKLVTRKNVLGQPDGVSACEWPRFRVRPGAAICLAFRVNGDDTNQDAALVVDADPGTGTFTEVYRLLPVDATAGWALATASWNATGAEGRLRIRSGSSTASVVNDWWYVDAVVVGEADEVITSTLWDAVVSDLQDITTTNGFDITMNAIYENPVSEESRRYPSVMPSVGDSGIAETDELGNRASRTVQDFELDVAVKSPNRYRDLLYACDSIRNAVERSSSNVLAVSGVELVDASSWEMDRETNETANQRAYARVTVRVQYQYIRGSA